MLLLSLYSATLYFTNYVKIIYYVFNSLIKSDWLNLFINTKLISAVSLQLLIHSIKERNAEVEKIYIGLIRIVSDVPFRCHKRYV